MYTSIVTNGDYSIIMFPRCGQKTLIESLPFGWNFTNKPFGEEYYLIRNPLDWMLSRYNQSNKLDDFKQFILKNKPEVIPRDANVLRLEYLVDDMDEELNIQIKKLHLNKGPKHITPCLSSRVLIRQYYSLFYKLGEYD